MGMASRNIYNHRRTPPCGHPTYADTPALLTLFPGPVQFSLWKACTSDCKTVDCGHPAILDTFCPALRCPHWRGSTVLYYDGRE